MSFLADPLFFALIMAAVGMAAGLIAGLFGVGGGIVLVPAMVYLFHLSNIDPDAAMHVAVGISMMTVVPTSIASMRAHAKHEAIDKQVVKSWMVPVILGSLFGSIAAHHLPGMVLTLIFGVFMLAMAIYMGLIPARMQALKNPPRETGQRIIASVIGFFSALIGIGGGSLTVPTLVLCGKPIHRAVGTASVMGLLISVPAALVFLTIQFLARADSIAPAAGGGNLLTLELIAGGVLALSTISTAPFGARLAHKTDATKLRRAFALLLALIAVKMLSSVV